MLPSLHLGRSLARTIALLAAPGLAGQAPTFQLTFPATVRRPFVASTVFTNRFQDWRIAAGQLECTEGSATRPMRVAHLLTISAGPRTGTLTARATVGALEPGPWHADACAGFLLGIGGDHVDPRASALVHHRPAPDGGFVVGVDAGGLVVFRDFETWAGRANGWSVAGALEEGEAKVLPTVARRGVGFADGPPRPVTLSVTIAPHGDEYDVSARAHDDAGVLSEATLRLPSSAVSGNVALLSHRGARQADTGFWFRDVSFGGTKLEQHAERAFGPILGVLYTLSHDTLKLTAQMAPLGDDDAVQAELQLAGDDGYVTVATATLVQPGNIFPFRVDGAHEHGIGSREVGYRVVYRGKDTGDDDTTAIYDGVVRREPRDADTVVVAALSCVKHFTGRLQWNGDGLWFPHADLAAHVAAHDPDLLAFLGDQIYEGDLTEAQRRPAAAAELDYQDKWARWIWSFRELTRTRPTVCLTDDHDVYHGNLWGAGGVAAKRQDDGGYTMPPRFVNMVQATQTSHLPDPVDPAPAAQGIGVYFTRLDYAGVSFALLEDRKFKSSPTVAVPDGQCRNGWFQADGFDPRTQADVPGAELLGARQLAFLDRWATDFRGGTWAKVALSQTVFVNVATAPAKARTDASLPQLPIPAPGEYPSGEEPAADADSNGWPPSARNAALRALRRGLAVHVAGDQHLASLVRYGVDDFDDAGFAFCTPAMANAWPRRWFPPQPGAARRADAPRYTGRYLDGFGNHMTVHAVANPVRTGRQPAALHDRVPGYGIVRLRRTARTVTFECWPRAVDPSAAGAAQYEGWPVTVPLTDNGPHAAAWLPTLLVAGTAEPVVQVIDPQDGGVVYTLRAPSPRFRPWVARVAPHTVRIGDPDRDRWRELRDVAPGDGEIAVDLR
ncbi:MAG: alkaline phosphatase D family protein [Planctomycetota bacterium]